MTTKKTDTEATADDATPVASSAPDLTVEDTTTVVLAYPWTDERDVEHAPDTTVQVPADTASALIRDGRARAVDTLSEKE